jgi:hypothetical protein
MCALPGTGAKAVLADRCDAVHRHVRPLVDLSKDALGARSHHREHDLVGLDQERAEVLDRVDASEYGQPQGMPRRCRASTARPARWCRSRSRSLQVSSELDRRAGALSDERGVLPFLSPGCRCDRGACGRRSGASSLARAGRSASEIANIAAAVAASFGSLERLPGDGGRFAPGEQPASSSGSQG